MLPLSGLSILDWLFGLSLTFISSHCADIFFYVEYKAVFSVLAILVVFNAHVILLIN